MKTLIILIALALSGCATQAPRGCSGEVRRVNPPSATNVVPGTAMAATAPISCPRGNV